MIGSVTGRSFNYSRINHMIEDMVVVHLRILKPEVQVIDAKYTTLDKFANIGGNFGIFAELTGGSILGIINFLILFFKLLFSSAKLKSKNTKH